MTSNQKPFTQLHLWDIRAVRDLFFLAVTFLLLWFGYYLRAIFTPLLIAVALAYAFNPLIHTFEKRFRTPRVVTISIILGVLIAGGITLTLWLAPVVKGQLSTLAAKTPNYLQALGTRYGLELGDVAEQFRGAIAHVQQKPLEVVRTIFTGTTGAFGFLGTLLGTSLYTLVSAGLVAVYFVFFAWNFDSMFEGCKKYLPQSKRNRTLEILGKMDQAVSSFFRGRALIAILMGFMFSVGWLLAGVPYWFLLGFATGLLSIIPYVSVIGWPLALLLKYLDVTTGSGGSFDWVAILLWPSIVYILVQGIEGWLLTPWIQAKSTDLGAMTILIVVFVGGAVAGLYGLLLAIPLAACGKILLKEVFLPELATWAKKN